MWSFKQHDSIFIQKCLRWKMHILNWTFLGNIDTLLIEASKRKYRWEVAFFNQDWHLCSETVTERVNTHDDIR